MNPEEAIAMMMKHNLRVSPDITEGPRTWRAGKVTLSLSGHTNIVLKEHLGPPRKSAIGAIKAVLRQLGE